MKLRSFLTLLSLLLLLSAIPVVAQDYNEAIQTVQNLRGQLSDVQNKEADLKTRIQELEFEMKPESLERYFNLAGSTRPEELREQRRRQLQIEKDRAVAQLEQLGHSRQQLEIAVANAQAKAYQLSAQGHAVISPHPNRTSRVLMGIKVLGGITIVCAVLGLLAWRLSYQR